MGTAHVHIWKQVDKQPQVRHMACIWKQVCMHRELAHQVVARIRVALIFTRFSCYCCCRGVKRVHLSVCGVTFELSSFVLCGVVDGSPTIVKP